ncbi:hypothetical protein L1887_07186 [Cichorium endivia]|nr:hypothetical protein L1887_07186 [Cichorium endivia]
MITHDPYEALSSWNASFHFCDWSGVSCGKRHRRVTALVLEWQGLEGSLSPHIGNLSFLRVFSLVNNSFQGTIPHELSRLSRLRALHLGQNKFSGVIPTNLRQIENNEKLAVPIEIEESVSFQLSRVRVINRQTTQITRIGYSLYSNKLELHIPSSLGNCNNLLELYLDDNKLNGKIPKKLLQLSSLSISLGLSQNNFFGSLPTEVGDLKMLTSLDLSNNDLSDYIPSSLGGCISLSFLSLRCNLFQGMVPPSLSSMRGLSTLDLSHNNLWGQISPFLERLVLLEYLNLSFNDFEG